MSESGIISGFKFVSYKFDHFKYDMRRNLELLEIQGAIDQTLWNMQLALHIPIFYKSKNVYLCGINCNLNICSDEVDETGKKEKVPLVEIETSIVGLFKCSGQFDKKTEDTLVKIQMPAILFPYLRGGITSFLANAGFGSVILPLINIHELAHQQLDSVEIKVIE